MEMILNFYAKVLDGPIYIIVSIICGILICACIGYMGEKYLENKKNTLKEVTILDKVDNI
ncbi:MAG: hypothetical protein RR161_03390 [Bacilli bacterium]